MKKIFLLLAVAGVLACSKEENAGNDLAPVVSKIYLEDAQSSVTDRLIADYPAANAELSRFARLGQTIRLEGRNLLGVSKVVINGYQCSFNSTLMSQQSMIVSISGKVPVKDAEVNVKNKITLSKLNGASTTINFEIRAAAPTISNVSHTMPQAGERITLTGTNMTGVTLIEFPGGVTAMPDSSDGEEGKWVKVTVPAGVTGSGSVNVTTENGVAKSAINFNYKEGLLHNFDDVKNKQWSSGMDNEAEVDAVIPATGAGPKSQGLYTSFNSAGNFAAGSQQRYWLNSTNIGTVMSAALPGGTATDMCGIQMDIYVDGVWTSGLIRMTMRDGWGDTRGCMIYSPVNVGGAISSAAFVNPGEWFTVTFPLAEMTSNTDGNYGGKTLADVLADMAAATYAQAGPWFDNSSLANLGFEPAAATQKIYFDNIRIVPLEVPATSDYPEEEEE